jgi:hypothetical protein
MGQKASPSDAENVTSEHVSLLEGPGKLRIRRFFRCKAVVSRYALPCMRLKVVFL